MREARPLTGKALERANDAAENGYRNPSEPRPGFFAVRMVRGGPEVAAALWYGPPRDPLTNEVLERSHRWRVFRNGAEITGLREPEDHVLDIWIYGRRLTADEYKTMLRRASQAAPYSILGRPDRPIDLDTAPLPF